MAGERPLLPPWRGAALVAAGGAVGAAARTRLGLAVPVDPGAVPWATLGANVTGAFLLAWLLTVLVERLPANRWARPLLGTGLLGAYTTFATVGLELRHLTAGGQAVVAAGYLALTWTAGVVAVVAGIALGRRRSPRRSA